MSPGRPLRLLFVVGTRPDVIKLAPVVRAARAQPALFDLRVLSTGQHRDMLGPHLALLGGALDADLDTMQPGQDLAGLVVRIVQGVCRELGRWRPDWLVVQGDTTTALAAALAAAEVGVAVAHVEAGLRTGDLQAPFPEEANRVLVGRLARLHCAPTPAAADNLLREGVPADTVVVTGNTAIDALHQARDQGPPPMALPAILGPVEGRRLLLVTGHRREAFGAGLGAVCAAIQAAVARWPDLGVVFLLHLNPLARAPVELALAAEVAAGRVALSEPLDHRTFLAVLAASWVVVTDSGGVQEEAPTLGKPVLCTRDVTERGEGVAAGVARLVGTDPARIEAALAELHDPKVYAAMARAASLYGDGRAAERILGTLVVSSSTS